MESAPSTQPAADGRRGRVGSIYLPVFIPAITLILAFVLFAVIVPGRAQDLIVTLQDEVIGVLGWYYVGLVSAFVIFAVVVGAYSALRQYSILDYGATTLSFLGLSMPLFWLALAVQVLIVYIFEWTGHRIFPIANLSGVNPGQGIEFALDRAHHLVMPVFVLMVASVATYSRFMRAAMLEVIHSDYVRTARAKGLSDRRVTMRHAFRNALVPLVTVVAVNFGTLIGGAIVTETVFSLDGMGLYFINALGAADPYPVMAWLTVTASMIIVFNLIADILYGIFDPRVRYD
jgi:peptide/nickel transport system permease protein